MKSIIIIIALFLVTLTAQADWVTKNGLEQIQLPDSNFFFTKVNDSCTKMLLVSQKNLKLYIVDLTTGNLEREQKIPYNFDICDYDFELESFVFYEFIYNYGNPDSGLKNKPGKATLFKLNKNDILEQFADYYNLLTQTVCYREIYSLYIINHNLYINVNSCYLNVKNDAVKYKVNFSYTNLDITKVTSTNYGADKYFRYQGGILLKSGNPSFVANMNGLFKFSLPVYQVLDINFNYLVFQDSNNVVNFYSLENGQLVDYNVPSYNNLCRNFKLVSSPKYSVFYKDSNRLTLCDNQLKKLVDTINLPEGNIGYSDLTKYAYSFVNKFIYRNRFNKNIDEYDDIFTDLLYYITTDSITLLKNINKKDSNLIWKVNGKLYYGNKPKLQIDKAGFYKVELEFERNGKKYTIQKDSLINVVDSLIYADITLPNAIEIIKPKSWSYKQPFKLKKSWKTAEIDSYKWFLNDSLISKENEFDLTFEYCKNYKIKLEISSRYYNRSYTQDIIALQDFSFSYTSKIGESPFKTNLIYSYDAKYDSSDRNAPIFGGINLNLYQKIGGFLEEVSNTTFTSKSEGNINFEFKDLGIYHVKQINYLKFDNWVEYTPIEMDTAFVVLAPSDIQDFAERKYIFKQDADGIFCQLEGEGEVALYDKVGRLVRTYKIDNEKYIPKEDLERGVYFLRINVNGEVFHEKVLVE